MKVIHISKCFTGSTIRVYYFSLKSLGLMNSSISCLHELGGSYCNFFEISLSIVSNGNSGSIFPFLVISLTLHSLHALIITFTSVISMLILKDYQCSLQHRPFNHSISCSLVSPSRLVNITIEDSSTSTPTLFSKPPDSYL